MPRVTLIIAHAQDGAIGLNGRLPWPHHAEDMRRFREVTLGQPVIMGRRTWESLDGGLPYRQNIVVTSSPDRIDRRRADPAKSFDHALKIAGEGDIFVIGGSRIFAAALPHTSRFLITVMEGRFPGDVYFKVPFLAEKRLVSDEIWIDPDPALNCRFLEYADDRVLA